MLHMIFSSPFQNRALQQCVAQLLPGDEIVLLQDGVVAATAPGQLDSALKQAAAVYVLETDILARGLAGRVTADVEVIDHDMLVALTVRHPNCMKWA
ncbi:sulfurtransferase complex subunit TusB [Photobacterium halotolerans]|uniref:Sulfurtransferase complex subunit TusB n=1 Tax=Photobacterium halotolerans TaxID=265726 RepID=A0A7X5AXP4_9GAMM|nr:sulfurtransferase complex subunit TusB [Photobacterium halotolerans]NAW66232.1 sulfurtransferase complex subunit TusB [Photobacterium halotolerans]NAW85805.1 sulfurtransferase complex subunit TusB [Photobacterium halotolerans]NAX47324.1 sulfurtransferase complex subunit TusB [Photobacterium halotolerans]